MDQLISLPVVSGLRALIAGAVLLFAPGDAVLTVLFPRRDQLSLLERGAFSVGASLATVALQGIRSTGRRGVGDSLDRTPWGLTLRTLLVEQVVVVSLLFGLAQYRRNQVPPEERAVPLAEFTARLRQAWTHRNAVGSGSRVVQVVLVAAMRPASV